MLFLLILFSGKSQTIYPKSNIPVYIIGTDTVVGFSPAQCRQMLIYFYGYSWGQEQVANLTEQVKYQDTIISGYEQQMAGMDKIITAYKYEVVQTGLSYKQQAIQYSKMAEKYDKLYKRQFWYLVVIGVLTAVIIIK